VKEGPWKIKVEGPIKNHENPT